MPKKNIKLTLSRKQNFKTSLNRERDGKVNAILIEIKGALGREWTYYKSKLGFEKDADFVKYLLELVRRRLKLR